MYREQFGHKVYGRIFVKEKADIMKVDYIVKAIDEFEHSYMPNDFIAVYSSTECPVTYGHKFELDMDKLRLTCFEEGIPILLVTGCREGEDWREPTP